MCADVRFLQIQLIDNIDVVSQKKNKMITCKSCVHAMQIDQLYKSIHQQSSCCIQWRIYCQLLHKNWLEIYRYKFYFMYNSMSPHECELCTHDHTNFSAALAMCSIAKHHIIIFFTLFEWLHGMQVKNLLYRHSYMQCS